MNDESMWFNEAIRFMQTAWPDCVPAMANDKRFITPIYN
jgi:hypothetical protein